jgi:prophage regulatory protein
MPDEQFLRLPAVIEKVALSKPHIYRLIAKGQFPSQHRLSERISVWKKSEIEEWMKNVH